MENNIYLKKNEVIEKIGLFDENDIPARMSTDEIIDKISNESDLKIDQNLDFTDTENFEIIEVGETENFEYTEEIQEVFIEIAESTEEEIYLEKLNSINLQIISSPKEIKKGGKFLLPYEVLVLDLEGNPVSDFELSVKYPVSNSIEGLNFENSTLITDENGKATFIPENSNFSARTKVSFLPEIPASITPNDELLEKIKSLEVTADYLVKSNIFSAVLFVWDYNELNKPTGNSYDIITSLKKRGCWNVGNAPVNDESDITKNKKDIYDANYEIIGKAFDYLIGGTYKFTKRVEKVENGYEASIIADIYVIRMKDGKEIYKNSIENTSIGANWNIAVGEWKTVLSEKNAEDIFYS